MVRVWRQTNAVARAMRPVRIGGATDNSRNRASLKVTGPTKTPPRIGERKSAIPIKPADDEVRRFSLDLRQRENSAMPRTRPMIMITAVTTAEKIIDF